MLFFYHKTAGDAHRCSFITAVVSPRREQINLLYSSNYEFQGRFSNQSVFRLKNDRVVHSYKAAKALVPVL